MALFSFNENEYHGKYLVKYVLEKEPGCKKLLIVFSAFSRITAPKQHVYNYMRSLQDLKCNKLFILDGFGPRGAYYMVDNMNPEVEDSVIALIDKITAELNLSRKDIIAAGSSKGGSTALYYRMKYRFGSILAGAPQTFIGDYVTKVAQETADFMLGTPWTNENIDKLNRKIYDCIDSDSETEINILSSCNDWQYQVHVVPFLKELDKNSVKYNLIMLDAVKNHADIANYFPPFIIKNVLRLAYSVDEIGDCSAVLKDSILEITNTVKGNNIRCRYKVCSPDEQIEYVSCSDTLRIHLHLPGSYTFSVDILHGKDVVYKQKNSNFVFGGAAFTLRNVKHTITGNRLCFTLGVDAYTNDICYSFYLVRDGVPEKKVYYLKKPTVEFEVIPEGNYRVLWFIHLNNRKTTISDQHIVSF